jgi:hypothetical protein
MRDANVDEGALAFFNRLSGKLDVRLTKPTKAVSDRLLNRVAPATARVVEISMRWSVYENESFRDLRPEEWSRLVLREPRLRMRGESESAVEHAAPDGRAFTVRDLAAAVEETERRSRDDSEWLGGVDAHHVFFEGIDREDDGVWTIRWGS